MIVASALSLDVVLAAVAAVAYGVSAAGAHGLQPRWARVAFWSAWLLHGIVLALALIGDDRRFGFAPALSMTAWLVGAVYPVESLVYPSLHTRWAMAALGAVATLMGAIMPGQPLHNTASAWLPLHWMLGLASYGLFGMAVVHAWFMTRAEARIRLASDAQAGLPLLTLERLTFRFVTVGFLLLSATMLAGIFFGGQLYGAAGALRLTHKTAFALLSWLTFATLLWGRQHFGWRGKRAVRVLYLGAALLLLAYVGSRFVLEVVLQRPA